MFSTSNTQNEQLNQSKVGTDIEKRKCVTESLSPLVITETTRLTFVCHMLKRAGEPDDNSSVCAGFTVKLSDELDLHVTVLFINPH